MLKLINTQYLNTIVLSCGFFLLITADYCLMGIQKLLATSIKQENPGYEVDGYIILSLIFLSTAIALLLTPPWVSLVGCKASLCLSSVLSVLFVVSWTAEIAWATYLGTVLNGVSSALLWVGQGSYLVLNSDPDNAAQHASISWAFYGLSLVSGNIFTAAEFYGKTHVDFDTRRIVMMVMIAITAGSTMFFGILRAPYRTTENTDKIGPVESIRKMGRIVKSGTIFVLFITHFFNGSVVTFSIVFPTAIGFTNAIGNSATLMVPVSAGVFGVGTVAGSLFSSWMYQYKKTIIYQVWIGFLLFMTSTSGLLANIPNSASFDYTDDKSYMPQPKIWLLLLCSFVVGVADSFYNTHGYRILAALFPDSSVEIVAVTRCIRNLSCAMFLYLSSVIGFHVQCLLLVAGTLLAAVNLHVLERRVRKGEKKMEPHELKATMPEAMGSDVVA